MGAGASIEGALTLEQAKALAGDAWSADMEAKFAEKAGEGATVSAEDITAFIAGASAAAAVPAEGEAGVSADGEAAVAPAETPAAAAPAEGATPAEGGDGAAAVPAEGEGEGEGEGEEEKEDPEAARLRELAEHADGECVIKYNMYDESFAVAGNAMTAASIDELYGLTDVMPGCWLRLSKMSPAEQARADMVWEKEEPAGTFVELLAGETYYLYAIEDREQFLKDQEETRARMATMEVEEEEGERKEGCSCIYGNPCQDAEVCLDWENRFANAQACLEGKKKRKEGTE